MAGEDKLELPKEGIKLTEIDGEPAVVLRMPDGSAVARPLKPTSEEEEEKEA